MKHRNLLLSLLISGSFVFSIQNIESFKSIKTYAEESSEIVKYCGNTSNGNDLYIRKDDSFQLAGNKISVSKNSSIIDDTYLRDAESYTSYGGRLAISDGDSIEINFEDASFNGCRQIESIATHFSSSGIKVNYFVKKNGESNYVDTEISTSTSFGNNQSFHSLSKLSNETIFSDVKSLKLVFTLLPESTALNINVKEIDIFLKEDPSFIKEGRDEANKNITMPKLFCDHMILKHSSNTRVYGYGGGKDNNEVTVKVLKNGSVVSEKKALVKDYFWCTEIDPIYAGLGYELEVVGPNNSLSFTDVAFGEVYLASGQSNMQRTMEKLDGKDDANYVFENYATNYLNPLKDKPNNMLRLFNQSGSSCRNVYNTEVSSTSGWTHATFDDAYKFSAVGYFFGDSLQKSLDIPVGIIYAAVGGSRIQEWLNRDILLNYDNDLLISEKQECINFYNGESSAHSGESSGNNYNSYVAPLRHFSISGVTWYQGESNTGDRTIYHLLMDALEKSYRDVFEDEHLPFLVVQLAPYSAKGYNHHYIANVQTELQFLLDDTYTIGIYDTITEPDKGNIHPQNKKPVGERLANLARQVIYGEDIEAMSPSVKSVTFEDEIAILEYNHVGKGFDTTNPINGFEVSEDGVTFFAADAVANGNTVMVYSEKVNKISAVRYAYNQLMNGNLKTIEGLPALVYASDVVFKPLTENRIIDSKNQTKQEVFNVNSINELPTSIRVKIDNEFKDVNVEWVDINNETGELVGVIKSPKYLRVNAKFVLNKNENKETESNNLGLIIGLSAGGVVAISAGLIILLKLRKGK